MQDKFFIKYSRIDIEKIKERQKAIEELLQYEFQDMELNKENMEKAAMMARKYNKSIAWGDWNIKPTAIIVTNSDGTEIATINC